MRRVLVTRPEPGASATAAALKEAGFEPVLLPLTGIVPQAVDEEMIPPSLDAVAITSANAVRLAPVALLQRLSGLPVFAVGEATEAAVRHAGLGNVEAGPGDARGLAQGLVDRLRPGATVLYLCGRVRKPELERIVRDHGLRILALETYDTTRTRIADEAASRLANLSAVLVHSAEAAAALAELAGRPAFAPCFADASLVAISGRAARASEQHFPGRTVVSQEPNEAAMIDALRRSA